MALFLFALDKLNATTSLASNRSVCDLSGVFCIFLFSIANCRRARPHTATVVQELTKELERYRLPNKQVDNALSVMPEIH
jgi:hypothetical protein